MTVETELTRKELDIIEEAVECYQNQAYVLEVDGEKLARISKTLSKVKDLVFKEYQYQGKTLKVDGETREKIDIWLCYSCNKEFTSDEAKWLSSEEISASKPHCCDCGKELEFVKTIEKELE